MDSGGGRMRVTVEQIDQAREEELILRCHDPGAAWVERLTADASGQRTVCGWKADALHQLKLSEIYYFEVVDDRSFLYTRGEVYEAKEKLYEFERLCAGSALFRCSKSMILNAERIDYVRPSLSGRFEAVLSNGEKVVVSRRYVADLKRQLGI
jgi:DNA-binding LytR/AlgR family response regulator